MSQEYDSQQQIIINGIKDEILGDKALTACLKEAVYGIDLEKTLEFVSDLFCEQLTTASSSLEASAAHFIKLDKNERNDKKARKKAAEVVSTIFERLLIDNLAENVEKMAAYSHACVFSIPDTFVQAVASTVYANAKEQNIVNKPKLSAFIKDTTVTCAKQILSASEEYLKKLYAADKSKEQQANISTGEGKSITQIVLGRNLEEIKQMNEEILKLNDEIKQLSFEVEKRFTELKEEDTPERKEFLKSADNFILEAKNKITRQYEMCKGDMERTSSKATGILERQKRILLTLSL